MNIWFSILHHLNVLGVDGKRLPALPFDIVGVVRPLGVVLPDMVGVVLPDLFGVEVFGVWFDDVEFRVVDEDLGVGVFDRDAYVGVGWGVVDLDIVGVLDPYELFKLRVGVALVLGVRGLVGEWILEEELLRRFERDKLPVDPEK